jgi:hypothetical protein
MRRIRTAFKVIVKQDAEFQGIPQCTGIKVKKINLRAKKILLRVIPKKDDLYH